MEDFGTNQEHGRVLTKGAKFERSRFYNMSLGVDAERISPLATAKSLKKLKTAMGFSCKELAWTRAWRRIDLGLARNRARPGNTKINGRRSAAQGRVP
jgi:hypothetical protein